MRHPLSRCAVGLSALVALRLLACTSSTPPDEVVTTPGPPAPRVVTTADPSTSPATASGCEDFGSLVGSSLVASLDTTSSPEVESATISIAGRPVVTKLRVIALGDASSLVGRTVVLGADVNENLSTCTHCMLVAVGCTTDCSAAAWFYPRSGTATFTKVASAPGQAFEGVFENVELEQVTIDDALVSRPVANGACIRVPTLTFAATTSGSSGTTTSDGGTGGFDGGTSTSTSDGGSGSGSGGGGGGGGKTKVVRF